MWYIRRPKDFGQDHSNTTMYNHNKTLAHPAATQSLNTSISSNTVVLKQRGQKPKRVVSKPKPKEKRKLPDSDILSPAEVTLSP